MPDLVYMAELEPKLVRLVEALEHEIAGCSARGLTQRVNRWKVGILLCADWLNGDHHLIQSDMVAALPQMGCHHFYEARRIPWPAQTETTHRTVRDLVLTLRLAGWPILSDHHKKGQEDKAGYWLVRSREEGEDYLVRTAPENLRSMITARSRYVMLADFFGVDYCVEYFNEMNARDKVQLRELTGREEA